MELINFLSNTSPILLTNKAIELFLNGYIVPEPIIKNVAKPEKKDTVEPDILITEVDFLKIYTNQNKMIKHVYEKLVPTTLTQSSLKKLFNNNKKIFLNKYKTELKNGKTNAEQNIINKYIDQLNK